MFDVKNTAVVAAWGGFGTWHYSTCTLMLALHVVFSINFYK